MSIPDQETIECRSGGVVDAPERGPCPSGEWQVRIQRARAQAHVFVGKAEHQLSLRLGPEQLLNTYPAGLGREMEG